MRRTLIDAGPLIALFDKSDQYHFRALRFIEDYEGQLWSTWPVIAEASHMLDFSTKAQIGLLEWIDRGGIRMFNIDLLHIQRLMALTEKFDDVPMDLADATLIVASESKGINQIASIDSDFYVYRDVRNRYLENVFI